MTDSEPTRWEYETLRPPRNETQKEAEDPKAELNRLGEAGWEFVETMAYGGGGTSISSSSGLPNRVSQRDRRNRHQYGQHDA